MYGELELYVGMALGILQGIYVMPALRFSGKITEYFSLHGSLEWLVGFFIFTIYWSVGIGLFVVVMTCFKEHSIYQKGWGVGILLGFIIHVMFVRLVSR